MSTTEASPQTLLARPKRADARRNYEKVLAAARKAFAEGGESTALEEIAHLPDRVGYLWLKARAGEAIKIKTQELAIPQGRKLDEAIAPIRRDPTIGMRFSRKEYERLIAERDRKWTAEQEGDLGATLRKAYQRARGKGHES